MNIEEKVKMNLLTRGFDNKTQLNNRGLIGATIDETILEVVKNQRIVDVMCSGYVIRFNEADTNGIINKDAINIKDFEQMKVAGTIVNYEIDDIGVKIIKKFDLKSVSL